MTNKERIRRTLEGKPVDRVPVATVCPEIYHWDHFTELADRPAWELEQWLTEIPEEYLKTYRIVLEKAPFEILEPHMAPARVEQGNIEFVNKNGAVFRHDRKTGVYQEVNREYHMALGPANETQFVFDKKDIKEKIKIIRAEEMLASGALDYARIVSRELGQTEFIMLGDSLCGMLWACHRYLGQTNTLCMLAEAPDFIEHLSNKLLEIDIEKIRAYASAGADVIAVCDAMTSCDLISVKHYERFSLPFLKEMVREIHRLNCKAVLIYFGGIADRLEQIVSTGADGLLVGPSMKNYTNDLEEMAGRVGSRITLFGNIDPIRVLEKGTEEQLLTEMEHQAEAGKKARGFIMCTGDPITPATPLSRVKKFIAFSKTLPLVATGMSP